MKLLVLFWVTGGLWVAVEAGRRGNSQCSIGASWCHFGNFEAVGENFVCQQYTRYSLLPWKLRQWALRTPNPTWHIQSILTRLFVGSKEAWTIFYFHSFIVAHRCCRCVVGELIEKPFNFPCFVSPGNWQILAIVSFCLPSRDLKPFADIQVWSKGDVRLSKYTFRFFMQWLAPC